MRFAILFALAVCASAVMADDIDRINDLQSRVAANPADSQALASLIDLAAPGREKGGIVRVNALAALSEVAAIVDAKSRTAIVELMIASSRDSLPTIRREAYLSLSRFATANEVPTEIIIDGLREPDSDVAAFAAELVLRTKEYGDGVVLALTHIIKIGTHERALATLPAIGAAAAIQDPPPTIMTALLDALSSSDPEVKCEAALALTKFKSSDQRLLSALKELMITKNYAVRFRALEAIEAVVSGPWRAELIELLRRGAADHDPAVRERAEAILSKIANSK